METITRRARPTAASHAAKTKITMGIVYISRECAVKVVVETMIKSVSIIPSRHRSVDIRWDRKSSVPRRENMNAVMKLRKVGVIMVIMGDAIF